MSILIPGATFRVMQINQIIIIIRWIRMSLMSLISN